MTFLGIWEDRCGRGLVLIVWFMCIKKHTIHKLDCKSNPGKEEDWGTSQRVLGCSVSCCTGQKSAAQGRLQRVSLHFNGTVPNLDHGSRLSMMSLLFCVLLPLSSNVFIKHFQLLGKNRKWKLKKNKKNLLPSSKKNGYADVNFGHTSVLANLCEISQSFLLLFFTFSEKGQQCNYRIAI